MRKSLVLFCLLSCILLECFVLHDRMLPADQKKPIPDRLVVLTFDDSSRSHFTVARPLLKEYGFGATFFITEGFDFRENKKDYMTWDEIRQLHEDGFEIGNHTRDHLGITDQTERQLDEQLAGIERQCEAHGIPKPVTFAWPGNAMTTRAFEGLRRHGILFARRGGGPEYPYEEGRGFAYEPGIDHPLMLPSAGDARPKWELPDFIRATEQARNGRIAILQFHGVPDTAHNWVSSSQQNFEAYLRYLHIEKYTVIALRDLKQYVDPEILPADPQAVIDTRRKLVSQSKLSVERSSRNIAGWTLHIDERLKKTNPEELNVAVRLLENQLKVIIERVPSPAVAELQKVPLYFSSQYEGIPPRAEFHPGAEWLKENGRDPEMVRAVEFTNIAIFEKEVDRMPMFVLHELAHAYHFRVLEGGFDNEKIRHAWERARAAKTYERVERRFGSGLETSFEPAYGISNPPEFFAETTEALFGVNDFYPFTRQQLKEHDPEMELLLCELWGVR